MADTDTNQLTYEQACQELGLPILSSFDDTLRRLSVMRTETVRSQFYGHRNVKYRRLTPEDNQSFLLLCCCDGTGVVTNGIELMQLVRLVYDTFLHNTHTERLINTMLRLVATREEAIDFDTVIIDDVGTGDFASEHWSLFLNCWLRVPRTHRRTMEDLWPQQVPEAIRKLRLWYEHDVDPALRQVVERHQG